MNDAIKKITQSIEEIGYHYEYSDDKNGIVLVLESKEIGITLRYLIHTMENTDNSYTITIFTSELFKLKAENENKMLRMISRLNHY